MNTQLYNQAGEKIGTAELPAEFFDVPFNADVVWQVVQAQMANAREAIAHTKGRGEVRGGGKKPWRQKGTGRARHASIRSPIWKGGGVAFGPTKERNFSLKVNKKTARLALAMVFSAKARDGELFLFDRVAFGESKTKQATVMLRTFIKARDTVLLITPAKDYSIERAMRNIPKASVIVANSINVRDLLMRKYTMLVQDALPVIQKTYRL